jgi:hypothetical protein
MADRDCVVCNHDHLCAARAAAATEGVPEEEYQQEGAKSQYQADDDEEASPARPRTCWSWCDCQDLSHLRIKRFQSAAILAVVPGIGSALRSSSFNLFL